MAVSDITWDEKGQNPQYRQLVREIRTLISAKLNIDTDEVGEEDSFANVLGLDSMEIYDIYTVLEGKYNIEIQKNEMQKLENVKKTARLIYDRINEKEHTRI